MRSLKVVTIFYMVCLGRAALITIGFNNKFRFPFGKFYVKGKEKTAPLQTLLQNEVIDLETILCKSSYMEFGSLHTESQLMQNLTSTDFSTSSVSASTTPARISVNNNMHERKENECRRTELLAGSIFVTTTLDNSDTLKVILAPRKRRSNAPC